MKKKVYNHHKTMLYSKENLDKSEWWRGFLAFVVFLSHILLIVWQPIFGSSSINLGIINTILLCLGNISVIFFFVLSGILISYSGLNVCENGYFNWKVYLINRVSRIYPAFLIGLCLCGILIFIFPLFNHRNTMIVLDFGNHKNRVNFSVSVIDFIKSLFMLPSNFIQINGVLWTLFIEWWLYISAMFVFLAMKAESITKYVSIFLAISILAVLCFRWHRTVYVIIWYAGFLYTLYFRHRFFTLKTIRIICLLLFSGLLYFRGISILEVNNSVEYACIQILYALFFMDICLKYSGKYLFQAMSKYAYTLYVIHLPIILFTCGVFVQNTIFTICYKTLFLGFIVIVAAKFIAKYAENKYFFRKLIHKSLNRFRF